MYVQLAKSQREVEMIRSENAQLKHHVSQVCITVAYTYVMMQMCLL